ncbi:hypothetical protein DFH11DRAFT_1543636 [Phellopilus nigrolimitatus]|nr:hypothetical protein DFH11DRAFT_1543636 [Phellopilus nigrolimitatus]
MTDFLSSLVGSHLERFRVWTSSSTFYPHRVNSTETNARHIYPIPEAKAALNVYITAKSLVNSHRQQFIIIIAACSPPLAMQPSYRIEADGQGSRAQGTRRVHLSRTSSHTAVAPLPSKNAGLEVMVQGRQIRAVAELLPARAAFRTLWALSQFFLASRYSNGTSSENKTRILAPTLRMRSSKAVLLINSETATPSIALRLGIEG